MTTLVQSRRDAAFLATEANGHLSREVVTLAGGAAYPSGAVLSATGVGGTYALADVDATAAVVLLNATDATDGPVQATVIARDAEVKSGLIEGEVGTTSADLANALGANGIVIRASF